MSKKIEVPTVEVDLSHVPLRPIGAKEVRELELALVIATMLRSDIFQEILEPREFTTWLDSLAVAAGALAREKAGYPISKIAEELGRTESTIRNHLQGKTKAGKLVIETYEMLKRGKIKIALLTQSMEEVEELRVKVKELESKLREVKETLSQLIEKL
ncbi:MAG: transcriptional regulator [Desulfurococcales archaeon]|nr:transcriptional regulator [Desulfurococcales archaeon]MEB3780437.1 transcriptional regulator [Desulfurococcales archaeon]